MKNKLHLTELIVFVLLLSILTVIFVPKFLKSQDAAIVAQAKLELRLIGDGMEQFNVDHGHYPSRNGLMTNQHLYDELIEGGYVDKDRLKDPFLGPDDTTNDGDPSIYFWADTSQFMKYSHYNNSTNQYRGALPGNYRYNLGSTGPDKVINLDNPPYPIGLDNKITSRISIQADRTSSQNGVFIPSNAQNFSATVTSRGKSVITDSVTTNKGSIDEFVFTSPSVSSSLQPIQSGTTSGTIVSVQSSGIAPQGIMATQNGLPFYIFIDYDPTNGINSTGDIHYLGPN